MKTPKEKAEDLFNKYWLVDSDDDSAPYTDKSMSKKCALIAVDEILSASPMYPRQSRPMKRANGTDMVMTDYPAFLYWHEVRNEIEKL